MREVIEGFRSRRCHIWVRALGKLIATELTGLMEMWKNRRQDQLVFSYESVSRAMRV